MGVATLPPETSNTTAGRTKQQTAVAPKTLPGAPHLASVENIYGQNWRDFCRTLKPKYTIVWRDIIVCHLMIIATIAGQCWVTLTQPLAIGLAFTPLFALWAGYWLHTLFLFGHEAGHGNLAPKQKWNDRLADTLIWPFFGECTRTYRKSHWQHHKHLGDQLDTEISYHNCLSPTFLFKAVSGIYLVEAVGRRLFSSHQPKSKSTQPNSNNGLLRVGITAGLHLSIIGIPLAFSMPAVSAMWMMAAFVAFPFFASVRQILEHRDAEAHCETNFKRREHGTVNRMFGAGLFASTFGAAGFNRHLLHHWAPSVSYTCFNEMEAFLMETPLAEQLQQSRTTYSHTFRTLISAALHDHRYTR